MSDSNVKDGGPQQGAAPVLTDQAAVEEFMGGSATSPAPSQPRSSGAAYQPTVPLQAITLDGEQAGAESQPKTAPVLTDRAAVEQFMGGSVASPAPERPSSGAAAYNPTVPMQAVSVESPPEQPTPAKKSRLPLIIGALVLLCLVAVAVGGTIAWLF